MRERSAHADPPQAHHQKIVASIVDIARATGKQTIAEHVANEEIFEILGTLHIGAGIN